MRRRPLAHMEPPSVNTWKYYPLKYMEKGKGQIIDFFDSTPYAWILGTSCLSQSKYIFHFNVVSISLFQTKWPISINFFTIEERNTYSETKGKLCYVLQGCWEEELRVTRYISLKPVLINTSRKQERTPSQISSLVLHNKNGISWRRCRPELNNKFQITTFLLESGSDCRHFSYFQLKL